MAGRVAREVQDLQHPPVAEVEDVAVRQFVIDLGVAAQLGLQERTVLGTGPEAVMAVPQIVAREHRRGALDPRPVGRMAGEARAREARANCGVATRVVDVGVAGDDKVRLAPELGERLEQHRRRGRPQPRVDQHRAGGADQHVLRHEARAEV